MNADFPFRRPDGAPPFDGHLIRAMNCGAILRRSLRGTILTLSEWGLSIIMTLLLLTIGKAMSRTKRAGRSGAGPSSFKPLARIT